MEEERQGKRIETYTVKEIIEGLAKGFFTSNIEFRTVFTSPASGNMEDIKMIKGFVMNGKLYEMKTSMKRERVEEFDEKSPVGKQTDKIELYNSFLSHLKYVFPLFTYHFHNNKIYISDVNHDYEISFTEKKGVKI